MQLRDLSLHPDGKRFLTSVSKFPCDIWMLEGWDHVIVPVEVHYQWRPQLTDAGDEIVLEAAVNGRADAIVSFNHKDYKDAPGRFGIGLRTPAEVLREIRR